MDIRSVPEESTIENIHDILNVCCESCVITLGQNHVPTEDRVEVNQQPESTVGVHSSSCHRSSSTVYIHFPNNDNSSVCCITNGASKSSSAVLLNNNSKNSEPSNSQVLPHTSSVSVQSSKSTFCRICHNSDVRCKLISPCICKGSMAYVHRQCVERWLSCAGIFHCELCLHRFPLKYTLRYSMCESLMIWYRHPVNRSNLQSDILILSLLTIITFGLISISIFSLQYFMLHGQKLIEFSSIWTHGTIIVFISIVVLAYVFNLYFIARGQIRPWFRWWRSRRCVRLILNDNRSNDDEECQRV